MDDKKYLLSSVCNALEILDLLSTREPLSGAEISRSLKIGKSTAFRLLYTLESKGYVVKNELAKYMLGRKFSYFGDLVASRQDNYSLVRPELEKLRDELNETVHMSILLSNLHVMFVDKADANHTLKMQSRVGYEMPAYCSATGKMLMSAFLGTDREEELKKIQFNRQTKHTIVTYEELIEELKRIRSDGYAMDREESEIGLTCISVPIVKLDGTYKNAISVSGATQRIIENKETYIAALKRTAAAIAEIFGV